MQETTIKNARDIITSCNTLKTFWSPRNRKMKSWYKLIEMVDELAQEKMESFVGNDPRASYNLILGMLDQKIPHRIPAKDLTPQLVTVASELGGIFDVAWEDIFSRYRRRGRYWLRDFIGFLLATGWYSVFSIMSLDGSRCLAEIWNPATVFQNWDDELVEGAHIFTCSPMEARRMIARTGWNLAPPKYKLTAYDYWRLDDAGRAFNSIVLGTTLVKPETWEPRLKRIPIFTAPVGGLPDTGLLSDIGDKWKEEIGQSIVATNENIYRSWNKWWSMSTQLLRDTAQARIKEKSRSGKPIVKPEDVFRRGAIFRMTPEEDVSFMVPPPIPVELRASQLDMEAMMQRGGPSWAMYGAVQQQLSAYVMSQISTSVAHMAKPYHQAVKDLFTDIDNFWLNMVREQGYKPYGKAIPDGIPGDAKLSADYEIKIPGDIVQRATVARMLDPNFEVSPLRVMDWLFPEIDNPLEELAFIRAAKAERHPIRALIALIESFREEARLLREAKDISGAQLYEKAADLAEASLSAPGEEAPPRGAPGAGPQVVPPASPVPPATV